ncbi:DUF1269 domain-containing protein [Testudinibacter sp. TR-2022]|uniref:DUF1269 domain-containing protein n=1 Tax=Testudinibacter sp. TR-2022 TaxID=2585029 RepID=UPI00159B9806|nr:DUF1269 domain-containing protein [Testudinibacter sp. TR-2022]
MNKIIIAVFNTEIDAASGLSRLQQLHESGDITLYSDSIFEKNNDGSIKVHQINDKGIASTAIGLLVGGLVGVLAGPAGVAIGASIGGLSGAFADLYESGVDARFVDDVAQVLAPGKVALAAEIDEEWTAPVDAALTEVGGKIFRKTRAAIEDAQWASDLAADQAEAAALEADWKAAKDDKKAEIKQHLDKVKQKITDKKAAWTSKLDNTKSETEAKIKQAETQLKDAKAENKAKVQARIDQMKDNLSARKTKLEQSAKLLKEALHP